jgi:hypothetical protein
MTSGGGCPSGLRGVQIINGAVSNPASGEAQSPKGAVTGTVQAGGQWAAPTVSISPAAAVCVAAKALPASAKEHGWLRGAARLASRRSRLADQSTIMHGRAIGPPHHGRHTKSMVCGLRPAKDPRKRPARPRRVLKLCSRSVIE